MAVVLGVSVLSGVYLLSNPWVQRADLEKVAYVCGSATSAVLGYRLLNFVAQNTSTPLSMSLVSSLPFAVIASCAARAYAQVTRDDIAAGCFLFDMGVVLLLYHGLSVQLSVGEGLIIGGAYLGVSEFCLTRMKFQ